MRLDQEYAWRGRRVRWTRWGDGPPLVFCHGTPWSSTLWVPYAEALSDRFSVYLWDMPGYGQSSMDPHHRVSLDVQGELFADLVGHWGLDRPHVVAHDYGGAVSLRAHLLHGRAYDSLALVDVVALAPWGSDYFRLVHDNTAVFEALPSAIHQGALRAYVEGASHHRLTEAAAELLMGPWLGPTGQAAFYRQIAQADESYTDEVEPLYASLDLPVLVAWGTEDTVIPVDRAHRLAELVPGARLALIEDAGHLIQLDAPVALTAVLQRWLDERTMASWRDWATSVPSLSHRSKSSSRRSRRCSRPARAGPAACPPLGSGPGACSGRRSRPAHAGPPCPPGRGDLGRSTPGVRCVRLPCGRWPGRPGPGAGSTPRPRVGRGGRACAAGPGCRAPAGSRR